MSLGHGNMLGLGKRSNMAFAMRQVPNKNVLTPAGDNRTGEIPIKIKVEALEIAVGALSERLGDITDMSDLTSDADIVSSQKTIDKIEHLTKQTTLLSNKLDTLQQQLDVMRGEMNIPMNDSSSDALLAVSTQTVRATVGSKGACAYTNTTGELDQDLKEDARVSLAAGSHLRLVFPQEVCSDGRVFMGCVWVDRHNMAVHTGWVQLLDSDDSSCEPYLCNFEV
jgi:hypothetical protein